MKRGMARTMVTMIALGLAGLFVFAGLYGTAFSRWTSARWPADGVRVVAGPYTLHRVKLGEGPAVVLIHGAAAHERDLRVALGDQLADFATVYSVDRPGFGHSAPEGDRDRLAMHADALAALIAAEGLVAPVVVGHSYGGAVALRLALDHPDRVGGLVLLAPVSKGYVGPVAWYNHAAMAPLVGRVFTRCLIPLAGPASLAGASEGAFFPADVPDTYAEETGLRMLLRPKSFRANAADLSRANPELAAQQPRYRTITAPVAIIADPADTVVSTPDHTEDLALAISNAAVSLTPGAGHLPHHTRPEIVIEHVQAMLARRAAARGADPSQ